MPPPPLKPQLHRHQVPAKVTTHIHDPTQFYGIPGHETTFLRVASTIHLAKLTAHLHIYR